MILGRVRLAGAAALGLALALAAGAGACGDGARPGDAAASVVDGAPGADAMLRRFRAGLDSTPGLTGGAASREALARGFVAALATRDTAWMRASVMTRAEFAWLYFPTHRLARPPYAIDPALLWLQVRSTTERDLAKLLDRFGGRPLAYAGLACPDTAERSGENALWSGCVVGLVSGGDTVRLRAFGTVLERGGRHKFVGYANDL